ncbi:MAG: FKBP-type peptidyl-prolyl cis-trans isomerase [Nanohaloarchaea archaeon]|nr:FKBP-type peptidyl-prolyl cis-trans isomerase [Candidatus Nanohaloarchaea archaeon]
MEKGDMVLVDYVGKSDGEIFDLTVKEKAEEEGMNIEEMDFESIPVLIGEQYVIDGFEETLEEMEVGDEKEVDIPKDKAYGDRSSENVETYPEKEFKKQGVDVRRGEEVMVGNRRGKVISASSGRIKIDFNHPLAGKDLEYWIKVKEKVEEDEEKAKYIFNYRVGHGGDDLEFEDGTVKAEKTHSHEGHEHELPEQLREKVKEEIEDHTDFEVEFV